LKKCNIIVSALEDYEDSGLFLGGSLSFFIGN